MAVSSGIYSLAGVLIGGGITAGAQWSLAARTDRLDARSAKRQVRTELQVARNYVEGYTVWPEFPSPYARPIVTDKWSARSDRLARQLSDGDWHAVDTAYLAIEQVGRREQLGLIPPSEGQASPEDVKAWATQLMAIIDEAVERLR